MYLTGNYVVVDVETTNKDKGSALNKDNSLVLACWTYVNRTGSGMVSHTGHTFGDEYSQHKLLEAVYAADFIVAHNAKFEAQWLRRCGVDLSKIKLFCTMLGKWVLNGNVKKKIGLAALGEEYGLGGKEDYVSALLKMGVCPSEIPRGKLLTYCHQDVNLCHWLFHKIVNELNDNSQLHLALTRNLTALVLADIEFNGMCLDPVAVKTEHTNSVNELNYLSQELAILAPGVNLNSPLQRGKFLFETLGFKRPVDPKGNPLLTASGKLSTAAEVLDLLHPTTPTQERFLELYRRFNKVSSLMSKNLEFFKGVVDHQPNGTFYANLNQGVTTTHRLASTGKPLLFPGKKKTLSTQFQNMPRQFKSLFWAGDEDHVIGEVDGAALEFRVAAELCRDPLAIHEIETWEDVHQITADTLTRAGEKTSRQDAKASTFAPLFGGFGKSLAQKAYADFFKKKYKNISSEQRSWAEKVVSTKELRTLFGMRFYWPNCKMKRSGYIEYSTEIYNYPIQSGATGEIIPIALVHLWYRLKAYDSGITILNTVHDSIVCKFHKSKEEEFRSHATLALTTDVFKYLQNNYHYEFVTPLGVGIKVGRNWGKGKEIKTNVWPSGRMEHKSDE